MECNIYQTVTKVGVSKQKVAEIVQGVLKALKYTDGEVSVHFVGDAKMKMLNHQYRGKDKTTDVLSFAVQDTALIEEGANDFGDIFISVPQIKRQAKEHNVSFQEECGRMLIHGTLHLLGYDHSVKKKADVMFPLQEKFLKRFL